LEKRPNYSAEPSLNNPGSEGGIYKGGSDAGVGSRLEIESEDEDVEGVSLFGTPC